MIKKETKYSCFCILGIVALILGLLIYVLFRENTYISKIVLSILPLNFLKEYFFFLNNKFVKFYFVDYLWAFSFSCWLHIIVKPTRTSSVLCTFIVFFSGLFYELLQYFHVINGTGDIVDILLYLLAGLTVNIINKKER